MNKYYVLNNSNDKALYLKDDNHDTRLISESKRFTGRRLAEKFIARRKLSENYEVKLVTETRLRESIDSVDPIVEDIKSAVDDSKDIIDTTLDLIESYMEDQTLKEEIEGATNISDIYDKLKKVKKYMNGISFYPTFDNSQGSIPPSPDPVGETGGTIK